MVALGEATHYGSATFDAKVDLVKYLHRELGFTRVVLEAGLFSCHAAARALWRGAEPAEAARLCLFERSFCRDGAFPLFEYAKATQGTERPLQLSGMDPQLSGTAPKRLLLKELEVILGEPVPSRAARAIEHLFSLELVRSDNDRREDRISLLALLGRVRQLAGTGSRWSRIAAGLLFLDEDHWDYQFRKRVTIEMANLRDQHMGQNVLWWASQHPSEKMVVWAANMHVARTHDGLDIPDAASQGWSRRNSVPAGQWVADQLGHSYFAVAFSAASGQVGEKGRWTRDVGPARPGFLEHAGLEAGPRLLSRRELDGLGQPASLLLGGVATASWARLFDAVIVLPQEAPAEQRPDCQNASNKDAP